MAQQQKSRTQSHGQSQAHGTKTQSTRRSAAHLQAQGSDHDQSEGQPTDLLAAVTPAFQEARRYIEGSPIRAAAIGAIAGGALMTLFSTEKGRAFVKLAYDYANPMVAKYARNYISEAAGNVADSALSPH